MPRIITWEQIQSASARFDTVDALILAGILITAVVVASVSLGFVLGGNGKSKDS